MKATKWNCPVCGISVTGLEPQEMKIAEMLCNKCHDEVELQDSNCHLVREGVECCPLHEAAAELLEAARLVINTANKIPAEVGPEPKSIIALRRAIAKAERGPK